MSAFRADRRTKAFRLAAAGLFSVVAWPALAQAPIRLTPLDPEPVELRPVERLGGRVPAGVEVHDLKPITAESVGVLDLRQGGFAAEMWAGTPAAAVRKLVPMLPGATGSHVLRDLERRLLLTAATAPEGADEAARGGPSLVELRAERLMAIGDVDGLAALANATPGAATGPLLNKLKLEAMLAAGNSEGACDAARRGVSAGQDGLLAKVQVFCNLALGHTAEGNLGLDLLRERKEADHAFVLAAEVMGGLLPPPADKVQLAQATPLHVAAFNAAKMVLPAQAAATAHPSVLRAIALSSMPIDQRLAAAERGEALGVVSAEIVRKVYGEAEFTIEEMSAAIPRAEAGGPRAQALLYRVAWNMADQGVKAQIVAKALDLAGAKGELASAARIFAPLVADIRPAPEQAPVAATLAKALYSVGRPEAAAKWTDIARAGPDSRAAERLWPFAALQAAGGQQAIATTAYAAWRATQEGVPADITARRSALVLGLLAGLGADIPDAAWLDALDVPAGGPKPGLFALMQGGALDARTGITVLATLAAIGDAPLAKADTLTLSEAISALSVVGLTEDARLLAVEILLANGV